MKCQRIEEKQGIPFQFTPSSPSIIKKPSLSTSSFPFLHPSIHLVFYPTPKPHSSHIYTSNNHKKQSHSLLLFFIQLQTSNNTIDMMFHSIIILVVRMNTNAHYHPVHPISVSVCLMEWTDSINLIHINGLCFVLLCPEDDVQMR